jgi:nucleotide-binding universal stress UspA family protein
MYPFKRILVGLNLTDRDEAVTKYASMIANVLHSGSITFMTVASHPDIPESVSKEFPELLETALEAKRKQLEKTVSKFFSANPGTEVNCTIAEGNRLEAILRYVKENDIDLIVLGKKQEKDASGLLSEKLARKAPCSVLITSDEEKPVVRKILVALDFSEHSVDAVEMAVGIAKASGLVEINCLHVYEVPTGYSRTGKSHEEFAAIMEQNARKECEQFMKQRDLQGIQVIPHFALGERPSMVIREFAEKLEVDLIVVGARGRSTGAAIFLGSVTERLLRLTDRPLLAVKRKGSGLGFLEALFKE